MITNISNLLTPALMWSGITVIPAIEPAIRIIMNVGLLIRNRYQYHCKKRDFDPDLSFTKHSSYSIPMSTVAKLRCELLSQQIILSKSFLKADDSGGTLRLRLKNSDEIHLVYLERFKIYSGTYRKLSEDFLTREGVCYPPELKKFKDTTIPDSFSEENFNRWTGYFNSDIYDKNDLNQVKEFVLPECFSKESLKILSNYFHSCRALEDLSKNSLLEFYKLADYLEMPVLDGHCVIPFLKNILKNGQSELSETELKEIENSAILGAYTEQIKSLCASIKQRKDAYNDVDFPKELADLDLKMKPFKEEIYLHCNSLVVFGALPLYPLLLQSTSPTSWILLKQGATLPFSVPRYIPSAIEGLRFYFDLVKMVTMSFWAPMAPTLLILIGSQMLPATAAIFKKTAKTIYTIASRILYAPIFVAKETGKAILFTAKTLSKIPSIVHSIFAAPKLAPI